jgi:hypothetical protein
MLGKKCRGIKVEIKNQSAEFIVEHFYSSANIYSKLFLICKVGKKYISKVIL